jgi:hypothetical protein
MYAAAAESTHEEGDSRWDGSMLLLLLLPLSSP